MDYKLKYRILTAEELKELEPEFKQFLIVHGILDDEWRKINLENPDYAIELVEIFSDTVLEKVYSKISFLEYRTKELLVLLSFTETFVEQIRIEQKKSFDVDFQQKESFFETLKSVEKLNAFYGKKAIKTTKNSEIHSFVEQGFVICESEFWIQIKNFVSPS